MLTIKEYQEFREVAEMPKIERDLGVERLARKHNIDEAMVWNYMTRAIKLLPHSSKWV